MSFWSDRKSLSLFCLVGLFFVLICLIGDGKCGGDEAFPFLYWKLFVASDSWNDFLASLPYGVGDLSKHFVWFLLFVVWSLPLLVLSKFIPIVHSSIMVEWVMSQIQVVFLMLSVLYSYLLLAKKNDQRLSILVVILVWSASYGVSFLTGGTMEGLMCLLIVARLGVLSRETCNSRKSSTILALIDFFLIAIKPYSVLFCVPTLPMWGAQETRKERIVRIVAYVGVLLLCGSVWFVVRQFLHVDWLETSFNTSRSFIPIDISTIAIRFIWHVTSLSYGIFCTMPALLVLAVPGCWNKAVLLKTIGIVFVILFLSLFPFWNGANGIAGSRYIFPFLLAFLPDIANGIRIIAKKYPRLLLVVPILIMLFIPTINYRHNLVLVRHYENHGRVIETGENVVPYYDLHYHPGVFAWQVLLSKFLKTKNVMGLRGQEIDTASIMPATLMSRVVYLYDIKGDVGALRLHIDRVQSLPKTIIELLSLMPLTLSLSLIALSLWCMGGRSRWNKEVNDYDRYK